MGPQSQLLQLCWLGAAPGVGEVQKWPTEFHKFYSRGELTGFQYIIYAPYLTESSLLSE